MGQTWRRRNRKLFRAGSPTNGVNGYFFDGVAIGMGRVFSKAVAIVAIAVRARRYCAESLFDLEVAPVAINFVAGDALFGLRATLCVGSSRLGMLDCETCGPRVQRVSLVRLPLRSYARTWP